MAIYRLLTRFTKVIMKGYRPELILLLLLSFYNINAQSSEERIVRIPVMLPGAETEKILDVTERNGKLFLDGDIYLGESKLLRNINNDRSASLSPIRAAGNMWPDNVVPFSLSPNHPERNNILPAMTHISSRTGVIFVPRTNERNYVTFTANDDGCYSSVGMIGGEQFINMQDGCGYATAIHEIGHALGLFHEQSRTDRDEYVKINWSNIIDGKAHNFQKYIERGWAGIDFGVYDYESIMHYSANAFSINGQPTIQVKTPPAPPGTVIGGGRSLSDIDILSINNLYRSIPRSTSEIHLGDEIATSPNPPCIGQPTSFKMSVLPGLDTIDQVKFQYVIHNFRNGEIIKKLGSEFQLSEGLLSDEQELVVEDISSGDYILALWEIDDQGELLQLVNDGAYFNGRRIEITDNCNPPVLDQYEENDQEFSKYTISHEVSDSNFVFTTEGAGIHSIQDIDYYHFELQENINYVAEIDVVDALDDDESFSNDVVFDYKLEGREWRGFNDRKIALNDIFNGTDFSVRVRSSFPDDTGSYQLDVNIIIDPEPMLLSKQSRFQIEANDTLFVIPILSNRKWKVTGESDWVTDFTEGGFGYDTIFLSCDNNPSFDPREVEFFIETEDGQVSISVVLIQEGASRTLSTEYSQIPVCQEGNEGVIWVNSNSEWDATTSDSWIEIIEGTGISDGWVLFTTTENISNNARNGEIELKTEGISRKIQVFQPGRRSNGACLDPIFSEVSPEEGNISINVNTLQEWDVIYVSEALDMVTPLAGNGVESIEVAYPALEQDIDETIYRVDIAVQNLGVFQIVLLQTVDFSSSTKDAAVVDEIFQVENPIRNELFINISSDKISGPARLELRNINGNVLWMKNLSISSTPNNNIQSGPLDLIPGIYFLSFSNGENRWSKKLIKIE